MTDYNSDQGRELRRARLTVIRPNNAATILSKRLFDETYKDQHVVTREVMPEVEESERVMFCPACQEQMDDTLVAVRKLHVVYEQDPLRNYRALVTASCKGCGWNEIIPIEAPGDLSDEEKQILRADMSIGQSSQVLSGQAQSQWSEQMLRQYSKQSMLGQMYGAGPKAMKAIMSGKVGSIAGMDIYDAKSLSVHPAPTRGQPLADAVWGEYAALDKRRANVVSARASLESRKLRDQYAAAASAEMAKKIDREIMGQMSKAVDTIKIAPRPKYAVAPPPKPSPTPPQYFEEVKAMEKALLQEPDTAKREQLLLSRLRRYFK